MNRLMRCGRCVARWTAVATVALMVTTGCAPAEDSEEAPAPAAQTEDSAAPAEESAAPAEPTASAETEMAKAEDAPVAGDDVADAITGKVTYEGPEPKRRRLDTRADPKCEEMHEDDPLVSEQEVVSEDGEVKNVFVYVSNPPEGEYPPSDEPAILNQEGCRYEPHVFGLVAGTELEIHNSDPTLHNIRSFARTNRPFNYGQPEGYKPRTKTYEKPEEAIKIKCDVHPWMLSYLWVMEHPFFAVTDEEGNYEIPALPPGEYTVTAWHEVYGEQQGTVTIGEDGGATLDFTFKR